MSAITELRRAGFRFGYTKCDGRWVKVYIPTNGNGNYRIPTRTVNGVKTEIRGEEYDRLPLAFSCND